MTVVIEISKNRVNGPSTMTSQDGWAGIKGIVLDAVGTLIEPEPSVARAYADAALRQGVVVDVAEVKKRFGRHFRNDEVDEQLGPMVTDESIEHRRWRRIVANVLPDLPHPDRAFEELWDHFGRPQAWRCFPDVAQGIAVLGESGFRIRVASNFDGRLRAVAAGIPEFAGFVDTLVISSEIGYRKPHAAFYAAACTSLGLPPEEVLCVGDDPENDVRGAERAGLRGLLLDRDAQRPPGLASFPDLMTLADSISSRGTRTG
jgi:putative hydrolase of the HAD superfamily